MTETSSYEQFIYIPTIGGLFCIFFKKVKSTLIFRSISCPTSLVLHNLCHVMHLFVYCVNSYLLLEEQEKHCSNCVCFDSYGEVEVGMSLLRDSECFIIPANSKFHGSNFMFY